MWPIDVSDTSWKKSSYSNPDGGACIEVFDGVTDVVPVRDGKTVGGPVLVFGATGWGSFIGAVKAGELRG